MRLHRLEITAIGPFVGTEIIDFTRFDDSGLFLLEGPTGAGKSTIIDALAFALYGDVARAKDASKDRLRSDFAPASRHSSVDLVFEVSSGIYRVHRTPSYVPEGHKSPRNEPATLVSVVEDPASPDGFTTISALERGARQVDPQLVRLIGLKKDQFLQTVVLPQGKFAQFLTATSQEREMILRDIFDTRIFVDFQKMLSAGALRSRTRIASANQELDAAIRALADEQAPNSASGAESDAPRPDDPDAGPDAAERNASAIRAWAAERVDAAQRALADARVQEPDASAEAQRAQQSLAEARARNEAIAERSALLAQRDGLDARAEEISLARSTHANALAVVPLIPLIDGADEALRRHRDHEAALFGVLEEQKTDPPDGILTPEAVEGMKSLGEARRLDASNARARLADLLAVEATLPLRREEIDAARAAIDSDEERRARIGSDLETLPTALAEAKTSREAMRLDVAGLAAARNARDQTVARFDAAQRATVLIAALKTRSDELTDATSKARVAGAQAEVLREQWLSHTGASLAAELVDGSPCPVCGSLEHPSPASLVDSDIVTREDVRRAEKDKSEADDELARARQSHSQTVAELTSTNELAGGDEQSVRIALDEAQARVDALERVSVDLERLDKDIAAVEAQVESLRVQAHELDVSIAERTAQWRDSLIQWEADQQACIRAAEGAQSLALVDQQLADGITAAGILIDAAAAWLSSRNHADQQVSRRDLALEAAGFERGEEGCRSAASRDLSPDRLDSIAQMISLYDAERAHVDQSLASARLEAVADAQPVDLAPLSSSAEEAAQALSHLHQLLGALSHHTERVTDLSAAVDSSLSRRDSLVAESGPILRLAGIADATSRENLTQTPLASWVLVSRLDDVLAAANPRLLAISGGRYELISSPDDGTSSRKSGLGLRIVDHFTEQTRSPQTLSGGETFYTSLALALGLADVVTAEAGGVELRTVFIDEGFGSLDAATLDLVMGQLHSLKDSGRVVGVISHVDEMARQIPDQIQVRLAPEGGSTLRCRGAM